MRRLTLFLLPLLTACATGPSLQTRMTAYVGAPEDKLVQALGVPDKHITVNGVDYLAYVRQRAQVEPDVADIGFGAWGGPYWGPYYGGFYDMGLPRDVQVWSCEITFTVKDSRVWDVALKGNDCR